MVTLKKILLATTLSIGLIGGLAACNKSDSDGDPDIIVESSEGNVTKEMFYEELKKLDGADDVLQDLLTYVILDSKYEITDEDIEEELAYFKAQIGDDFDELLESQNVTIDEFKLDIKKSLLNEALILGDVTITDEEIEQYYENMQLELTARHILVEDEELAKEIKAELDGGADFAELAEEHSVDSTAEKGGDLGSFSAGTWIPEFEDALFELEVNEVSDLVETSFGYHIIEVTDIKEREDDIGTLDENWITIRRMLIERKIDHEVAQTKLNELFVDSNIKVNIKEFEDLFKVEEDEEEPEQDEDNDNDDEPEDTDDDDDENEDKDEDEEDEE